MDQEINSLSFIKETSIEEIKKHIVLVDNRPVIDKDYFLKLVWNNVKNEYLKQGIIPGQKITPAQTLFNFFNIYKNVKQIKVNLDYQEKFKKLLDDIDDKFEEINSNEDLIQNELLYEKTFRRVVGQLVQRHKTLCENYYIEYQQ